MGMTDFFKNPAPSSNLGVSDIKKRPHRNGGVFSLLLIQKQINSCNIDQTQQGEFPYVNVLLLPFSVQCKHQFDHQ